VPSFLLLHVFLGLQRLLGPISTAKITKTKLWTLIIFFGWVILHQILRKVLDIICKDHLFKVCSFLEQPEKNSRTGPTILYYNIICMVVAKCINEFYSTMHDNCYKYMHALHYRLSYSMMMYDAAQCIKIKHQHKII
jgi:hypothetical protein